MQRPVSSDKWPSVAKGFIIRHKKKARAKEYNRWTEEEVRLLVKLAQ